MHDLTFFYFPAEIQAEVSDLFVLVFIRKKINGKVDVLCVCKVPVWIKMG